MCKKYKAEGLFSFIFCICKKICINLNILNKSIIFFGKEIFCLGIIKSKFSISEQATSISKPFF